MTKICLSTLVPGQVCLFVLYFTGAEYLQEFTMEGCMQERFHSNEISASFILPFLLYLYLALKVYNLDQNIGTY